MVEEPKRCDDCGEELGSLWFVFQEKEGEVDGETDEME